MTSHTVTQPQPLQAFLFAHWPDAKRTKIKQWLKYGAVKVNGKAVTRHDHELQPGDVIVIQAQKAPPPEPKLMPGLKVVHEDAAMLVIRKPTGLLTIATDTEREKTAFRCMTDWLRERTRSPKARLWIVHRLDRDTSGLLVLAKTEAAKEWLQGEWQRMEKRYLAIVEGSLPASSGTLTHHIDESQPHRVYALDHATASTRPATTHYQVLATAYGRTLVELTLDTGRRHQIRVQLSAAGCPIVGDSTYGAKTNPAKRLGLHATRLTLLEPETEKKMVFESALPQELARLVPQPASET